MKNILLLLALSFIHFNFSGIHEISDGVKIKILSPVSGQTLKGGTAVSIQIEVTCDCVIPKMMIMMKQTSMKTPDPLYHETQILQASNSHAEVMQITLPLVTKRSEFKLEVEVQDMEGNDMEDEEIQFIVIP